MDKFDLDVILEKAEEDKQVDNISKYYTPKKYNLDETEERSNRPRTRSSVSKKRKRAKRRKAIITVCLVIILIIIGVIAICLGLKSGGKKSAPKDAEQTAKVKSETILANAKIDAAQYNYEKAIAAVKAIDGYDKNSELTALVASWESEKANLVAFPSEKVTHVFVHSLIYDTSLAFDGDFSQDGYNLVMTTVSEFNKMIQTMYERGYVLVSMKDICTFDSEGNRVDQTIMLPKDKKAFVLSQDDLCYYHTQDGDGIADKLVIDKNGDVKCHYTDDKGNESIGDFDMVPIIDTFVKEHPDFSYHGRKGIIALTGYNGVFGYRTDEVYKTRPADELDPDQAQFLDRTPSFNFDKEVKEATKIANRMKETGWEFASHSWGHVNMTNAGMERIKTDTEKFLARVTPIIGETDCLIYANGGDIAGVEEYDSSNEKYNYLYSKGFRVFCPVDSAIYWQQKGDKYFRMSRRNLDGYRMYHSPELLEDLFSVEEVFDKARPLPVPDMSHYG